MYFGHQADGIQQGWQVSEHWSVFKWGSCLVQTTSIRTSPLKLVSFAAAFWDVTQRSPQTILKRANIKFIKPIKQKKITTVVFGSRILWALIDAHVVLLFLLSLSFLLTRYMICSTHFQTPGGIRQKYSAARHFFDFLRRVMEMWKTPALVIYYVSLCRDSILGIFVNRFGV